MNQSAVTYSAVDGVATLILNRPESLNAMNTELMTGISEAMAQVNVDKSVRVVVVTGTGRGFCAGADLANKIGRAHV